MKRITVIGLGYVGLPLAIAIQKSGKYDLVGFDLNQEKVDLINNKTSPLEDELVKTELKRYPIKATTDKSQLEASDIFIIAVPTPVLDDHAPDYRHIQAAATTISEYLKPGANVILESTVNPGTCEEVILPIIEKETKLEGGRDFNLSHCPERINPGDPKWNLYNIPRNIGSLNISKNKEIANFYRDILNTEINEVSSLKVAEATKVIENTFRDINIAYVNELAKSFDAMGIDLIETIQASSNKPFGFMAHWPGAGVGGHCIAVDPYYLIKRAEKSNFNHRFLKEAREINNSMPEYTVKRLAEGLNRIKKPINGTKVGVLGLAYKPEVADLRESPAFEIIELIKAQGGEVMKFDPYFEDYSDGSLESVLEYSDAIVLITAHKKFLTLTGKVLQKYGIKVIVDGRNKLDKQSIISANIIYQGIGR